jgi:hypothetical protein
MAILTVAPDRRFRAAEIWVGCVGDRMQITEFWV